MSKTKKCHEPPSTRGGGGDPNLEIKNVCGSSFTPARKLRTSVTEVTVMETAASLNARPILSGTVVCEDDLNKHFTVYEIYSSIDKKILPN